MVYLSLNKGTYSTEIADQINPGGMIFQEVTSFFDGTS